MLVVRGSENKSFTVENVNVKRDSLDEITEKIAEKISDILGRDIYKEDFTLWTHGSYVDNRNFRDLLKGNEVKIISSRNFDIDELFEKVEKEKILRLKTDQFGLIFKNSNIKRENIEDFLDGEKLILKTKGCKYILSLDGDFIDFKVHSEDFSGKITLSFSIEKENIRHQLFNYLEKYNL